MKTVASIIVTYNPDYRRLGLLLDAISPQVARVIVVDNSPSGSTQEEIQALIPVNGHCITLGNNFGIAEAINRGIIAAQELQMTHIALFDQDSLPSANLIECLLNGMEAETESGRKIAAVGPRYQDVKGQHASPFVKLNGFRLQRIPCTENEVVAVDLLITSGSLISMNALKEIGLMESQLFIDYVDTEWCLRAHSKGYEIIGVGSAQMEHDLGNQFIRLFGRTIPVHCSLRCYYLIRNGMWLLQQKWVSRSWKLMDARRLFLVSIVYTIFVGRRVENWKMITRGIWHAIIGRMGKYSE